MNTTKVLTRTEAILLCNGIVNIPRRGFRRSVAFSTNESSRNLGWVICDKISGEFSLERVSGFQNNTRIGTLLPNKEE
jgi:hypothetical protein